MCPTNYGPEGRTMNRNKIHRRTSGGGFTVAMSFLMSIIVLFGLICFLEKVQCVIQQEQSPSGEQNNNNDLGNNNNQGAATNTTPSLVIDEIENQEMFRTARSAVNSYSPIVGGVEGGNNGFLSWTRGAYNNKRARKITAFVPMRGRKDGRDDNRQLETIGTDLDGDPMADTNRGDSDSVHDWITSSTMSPSFWVSSSNDGGLQSAISQQRSVGTPVPIQFANQFAAHRMQQQQQQQRPIDSAVLNGGSGDAMSSPLILTPAGFGSSAAGVRPVKWRRAFHPMRGKKWAGNGNNGLDQNEDEVDMMEM